MRNIGVGEEDRGSIIGNVIVSIFFLLEFISLINDSALFIRRIDSVIEF